MYMKHVSPTTKGFSLIEIALVISIIGIFSMVAYSTFSDSRAQSRDKVRAASLQQLQLALELYKDKNGRYPDEGCGNTTLWTGPGRHPSWGNANDCPEYIVGLVPEFMAALPRDPKSEMVDGLGFVYQVSGDRQSYKVLIHQSVESLIVTSYASELVRCPRVFVGSVHCEAVPRPTEYAIYSAGAESW